jgi:hypothetical protein
LSIAGFTDRVIKHFPQANPEICPTPGWHLLEWLIKLVSVLLFFTSCHCKFSIKQWPFFFAVFVFLPFPAADFRYPVADPMPAESWPSAIE